MERENHTQSNSDTGKYSMSKKVILFGVVLIGSGLALLLDREPFLEGDDTPMQPSPAPINAPPVVSTVPKRADKIPDETRESEPIFDTATEDLFSSVEWRDSENQSNEEYPRTYAALRDLAESGDVDATRHLAALLRSCRKAVLPITEAELSAIVAEMRATYSYPMLRDGKFEFLPSAAGELSHKMSAAEFEEFIDGWHANVISSATRCNDVTPAQRKEADHWRDVFEAQGGVSSSWREATRNMDHDAKIAYVDKLWAIGDPTALEAYADLYGDDKLQLIDPSARVKSYAYIYAFYEALIETAKYHSDAERLARFQDGLKHVRMNFSDILSEHELKEAHELARQFIERNVNCCVRLPPNSY